MPKRPLVDIETGTPRAPVHNGVPPHEPLDEEALGWHEKQGAPLANGFLGLDTTCSPQADYLSQAVARDVAGAIGGRMQSAVSEAVQGVLEDRHLHFDMKANLGTLVAVTGVILFWRGIWNLWDTVVGLSMYSDILSSTVGLSIMLAIRYFRIPLARGLPEM